jgi:hypothetical protein
MNGKNIKPSEMAIRKNKNRHPKKNKLNLKRTGQNASSPRNNETTTVLSDDAESFNFSL